MTLEERYNSAGANTYVGRVRQLQAADSAAEQGVNFMDGNGRGQFAFGASPAPDEFQTEFTRNSPGDFKYGGGGKVPGGNNNSYILSRWLDSALQIAFGGKGPNTQPAGYWGNSKFTTLSDPRNANTLVHKYAPLPDRDFVSKLQMGAKGRVGGAPSGPSPNGVNG
jgi:hypothetical protein